jgi:ABC-2 type transport system permease protein
MLRSRRRSCNTVRGFGKLAWTEARLFVRQPSAIFFTIIFPLVVLLMAGSVKGPGTQPTGLPGGFSGVDLFVTGLIGLTIGTTALMGLPQDVAGYRERGILRRFQVTPLNPLAVLAAQMLVNLAATVAGSVLLVLVASVRYGLHAPAQPVSFVIAYLFCAVSLYAVGFLLTAVVPTAQATRPAGMLLYFPAMYLSGMTFPRYAMPPAMQRIGEVLPMTHMVTLLQNLWLGKGWDLTAVVVLTATLLICSGLTARLFRWQ